MIHLCRSLKIPLLGAALSCAGVVEAQVNMAGTGSYGQDFNTLNATGTVTWTDNTTIANWYAQRTGTGTTIVANAGASNAGNLYSYGTDTDADRALGSVGSANVAAGHFAWGVLLRNTSGGPITDIRVSYVGEQWRNSANATAHTAAFHYQTSTTPITDLQPNNNAAWTAVPALDFAGPITGGTAGALNGNDPANQAVFNNVAIPSLSLANNAYIMLKWDDPQQAGANHGLSIDDVLIEWTAEPSVSFDSATGSALENVGAPQPITLNIAPPYTGTGNIVLSVVNGPGATYGADYITNPAVAAGTITIPVSGANITSATFDMEPIDDALFEGDETVTFTITGAPAGLGIGSPNQHVFTIIDDEPLLGFSSPSVVVLESNAGPHAFQMAFTQPANGPGTISVQVTDGPGAVYGVDYTTSIAPVAGVISVPFANNALTAGFTVTVLNDAIPEDTEVITFTITGVTGLNALGSATARTLTIGDDDNPPTVFAPGDLLILGVNASNHPCSGFTPNFDDLVSFMCFQPITPGTELILTDNGYQRCNPGQWGNTEGTVRITRTGVTIPIGQVVTLRIMQETGAGNVVGLAPDAGWTCANINTPAGMSLPNPVALNANGDQIFFMQGGNWDSGSNGNNNATYDGTILYAFSTNPTFPWSADCGSSQRSDLPPGVECFSMAPTAASDFAKYTGPLTAATQRDWIIRADNQANWSTYVDCINYNGLAPDWLTAPILPIIPGVFVHGRWRGAISTDWFDCKNWDDVRIPDASTQVVISPPAAQRNCVVGFNGPSVAECASILQSTDAAARNLVVQDNSTLTIHGLLRIHRTVNTAGVVTQVTGGSHLIADSVRLQGTGPGAVNAILRCETTGNLVTVHGDVRIEEGGWVDLTTAASGGTLDLHGDWINQETQAALGELNSTVRFVGTGPQAIHMGSGPEIFANLTIDKPAGDVTIHAPIEVRNNLGLQNGRIMNDAGELVTLYNTAAALNASHNSFVHGPVRKNGNTDFTFPVGKGNVYRPAGLSGITGASSVAFTSEYFMASPRTTFNDVVEQPPLHHISDCEYWTIDRSNGTPNAFVTLSWHDPTSCIVDELPTLRIARWDGTMWLDRGNGGTTGTFAEGTIVTPVVQTAFSPWTLASINSNNPLPITLLNFDARPNGRVVDLLWRTASEKDNDHFTVERSTDGMQFADLLRIPGAGNSSQLLEYADVDEQPLSGLSYYRLRQTDFDGTMTWSPIAAVYMGATGALAVHAGTDLLTVFHPFDTGTAFELRDMTGRLLLQGAASGAGLMHLPAHDLSPGAYILRMGTESVRFVK